MKIEIPKTIKDCSPKQLAKWLLLTSEGVELETLMDKLHFRVEVVSIFSEVSKDQLRLISYKDINKVFNHCIELLATYESSDPSELLELDGHRYVFEKDIHRFSTGQAIDMKLVEDLYSNPYEVLTILYVEEGMVYNQLDEHERVINPAKNREKVFREHFPGDEFLNVFAFFLRHYENLKVAMSILKMAQTEIMMEQTLKELEKEVRNQNGSDGRKTFFSWLRR